MTNAPQKNSLGLTAFIFSLLGITCLPVLGAIVGLVCGIIAVRREPRGLAIAAIAISAVGGCLIVPVLVLPALLLPALGRARMNAQTLRTEVEGQVLWMHVESFRLDQGRMPKDLAEAAAHAGGSAATTDAWGNAWRFTVAEGADGPAFTISSAGRDGTFDTEDDVMIDPPGVAPAMAPQAAP